MKNSLTLFTVLLVFICSCDDKEDMDPMKNLNLNISGLEDLGSEAMYEGWLIVDGAPVSTGTFSVNANGDMSMTSFAFNATDLDDASTFVLTIEPVPNPSPGPSDVHLQGSDFSNNSASLSVGHEAALGDDFTSSSGKYILATPTDGPETNENSGIWFLDLSSGMPGVGLDLPSLPAGWKYEGWTVIDGQPVTSGKFTMVDEVDEDDPFSSTEPGPPFPGEDYLMNAPNGLTFPTDLSEGTAVISIEPDPDNSPNPFALKPLVAGIPAMAMDHFTYDMNQNLSSFPTGTASK